MKTKIILTLIGAAALVAMTVNVNAGDRLLSPRATGNEIKHVSNTANDPDLLAASRSSFLAPRAFGNRIVTVPGMGAETVAAKCRVIGSPRYLAAAGKAARMSCCNLTLAECSTMDQMPK